MADNVAITAGTGTTVATDEVAGVHYQRVKVAHGADGAATDVSTLSPLPVGGAAADDAAAAGNPVPIGGVYQATVDTVDEVDDDDVGRLRITARRGVITAADYRIVSLYPAVLTASPVTVQDVVATKLYSGKLGSTDGVAYGGDAVVVIPMLRYGWRGLSVSFRNAATAHDQNITLYVYGSSVLQSTILTQLGQWTIPTTNNLMFTFGSSGAVGQGGSAGGSTASDKGFYSIPAMAGFQNIQLYLLAGTTPSAGAFEEIQIVRWT